MSKAAKRLSELATIMRVNHFALTPAQRAEIATALESLVETQQRYRQLAETAYAVVESMDKPILGSSAEAAKAWKAATRLCVILNRHHGLMTGSHTQTAKARP